MAHRCEPITPPHTYRAILWPERCSLDGRRITLEVYREIYALHTSADARYHHSDHSSRRKKILVSLVFLFVCVDPLDDPLLGDASRDLMSVELRDTKHISVHTLEEYPRSIRVQR